MSRISRGRRALFEALARPPRGRRASRGDTLRTMDDHKMQKHGDERRYPNLPRLRGAIDAVRRRRHLARTRAVPPTRTSPRARPAATRRGRAHRPRRVCESGATRCAAWRPTSLRRRCAAQRASVPPARSRLRRWVPLSLAATLVLAVAAVFLFGLTSGRRSARRRVGARSRQVLQGVSGTGAAVDAAATRARLAAVPGMAVEGRRHARRPKSCASSTCGAASRPTGASHI